jgi:tetrahydromethanopterin S-methyltransferase subunit H
VVLTGDRESLINWIEQVGSNSNVPILAGITQSLAPAAAPYLATEQLEGALVGMADTAVYQQFYSSTTSNSEVRKQLNAQITAQLLVAIFLFIGALTYGISGIISNRAKKQS